MGAHLLASLTQTKKARTLRASSWDNSGRNGDAWVIEGERRACWPISRDRVVYDYLDDAEREGAFRNVVLKMFWDGEDDPSVEVPLGDFFCLGHGISNVFSIAALFGICECTARESICAQCRAELLFAYAV